MWRWWLVCNAVVNATALAEYLRIEAQDHDDASVAVAVLMNVKTPGKPTDRR
jgi:predicted TPR repeat methyltransferase